MFPTGIDQFMPLVTEGPIAIFNSPSTYQAAGGGAAIPINGMILPAGPTESIAPGYYCDYFICVGQNPGNVPSPPARGAHVTLNGGVYVVQDVKADTVGNGYRLSLHKDFA
jgi:hypothetical protein